MFASAPMIRKWNENGGNFVGPTFGSYAKLAASGYVGKAVISAYEGSDVYRRADGKIGGFLGALTVANGGLSDANTIAMQTTNLLYGAEAVVPNPAVPLGISRLRVGPNGWAPPSGEMIVGTWATGTDLWPKLVTPGSTNLTQIWVSSVIPDYMVPDKIDAEVSIALGVKNAVSQAAQTLLGASIGGSTPIAVSTTDYISGFLATPSGVTYVGGTTGDLVRQNVVRRAGRFRRSYQAGGRPCYDYAQSGIFSSGTTRFYVMAKPGHVSDEIQFDSAFVWAKGNI